MSATSVATRLPEVSFWLQKVSFWLQECQWGLCLL
jgi:hypothetical protein